MMYGGNWMDGWLADRMDENQKDKITFLKNHKKAKTRSMMLS